MDYGEIKKELLAINKEISNLRKKKTVRIKELNDLIKVRQHSEEAYASDHLKQAQSEKARYKEKQLKPYEDKRSELEHQLIREKNLYYEEKDLLTEENLMADCSDQQSILLEVTAASNSLRKLIEEILGSRFYEELDRQMQSPIEINDPEQLQNIVSYFNSCELEIEKISKHSGKITRFVNKFQEAVGGIPVEKLSTKSKADYLVVVLVLILVLIGFRYVAPVYVTLLAVGAVINLIRHYKVFKILLVQKTVRDNVAHIEEMLRQQVLEELDRRLEDAEQKYQEKQKELNAELEELEEQIKDVSQEADATFVFDDTKVRNNHSIELADIDQKMNKIQEELAEIEATLGEKNKLLLEKKNLLNSQAMNMQKQYVDPEKIGESYQFDIKFLVNVKDSKLEFFEHPESSCLFLYKDLEDMDNFIRIVLYQLRIKLNPFAFNVDVYDQMTAGRNLIRFKPDNREDKPSIELLFRVFSEDEKFKQETESYKKELDRRALFVLREYKNIKEYNKYMLDIDSLTETYKFIFMLNPVMSLLSDSKLLQQFKIGGDLGFFYHVFVKEDDFYKGNEQSLSILDMFGKLYILEKSGPKSKAQTFIEEKIAAFNQKS